MRIYANYPVFSLIIFKKEPGLYVEIYPLSKQRLASLLNMTEDGLEFELLDELKCNQPHLVGENDEIKIFIEKIGQKIGNSIVR